MKVINIILLLGISANIFAQKAEDLFSKANDAYKNEDYVTAVLLYDSIVEMGYRSVPLYYNLANSYFKNEHLAEAILYYERAARLAPGDEDIEHNLEVAREKTIDKFEKLPSPLFRAAYLSVMKWLSPTEWGWLSIICFGFFTMGVALYLFSRYRRPGFITATTGLLIGIIAISLAFAHHTYLKNNREAIIMTVSSYVKSAPSTSAADAFILHEGTKATIIDELEDWNKIRLADGKIGWIKAEDLEEI